MKRIFLIVLDSFGIGEAPDAKEFGDGGTSTLRSCYETGKLHIPTLESLGFGCIDGVAGLAVSDSPRAAFGRMQEVSWGKDTTIGHFELAGLYSSSPLPTYPDGFPEEIIRKFEKATGRGVLCNKPYSGTVVINEYGKEHIETGKLIVYTSADSVFQIAAHEEVVPLDKLYEYCRIARGILTGEHAVGRVIARPFITGDEGFVRTANRRDFSLEPPRKTMLDAIKEAGLEVIAVGKINDIYAARGITEAILTHGNAEGQKVTGELLKRDFRGLAFTNLVDFDSSYGHRQDAVGYARALTEFDGWLSGFIKGLREDDALIITADHGCDPSDDSTDHTREFVPLLVYGDRLASAPLGTLRGFGTVAGLVCELLGVGYTPESGEEIARQIVKD